MRDLSRIDKILSSLKEYWNKNPDLRLGQILCNCSFIINGTDDPFYLEDEDLIKFLEGEDYGKTNTQ